MRRLALHAPWKLPLLLLWLLQGRAHAKMRLARLYPIDAGALPYNEPLLAWLRAEHAQGRTLALATACDIEAARAVADHLGLFERVFASEGRVNQKSARKAAALARAFPDGFAYAGNERADLAVWRVSRSAVLVNASDALSRRAAALCPIEAAFPRRALARWAVTKALDAAIARPANRGGAR